MNKRISSSGLLFNLIHRDLTVRYKRSMLGFLWTMLNPVIMTAVYTVVFSTIFRFGTEDFVIYFFSAITNPMYHFVECFRCPIYNRPFPSFGITAMSVLIALVTLAVGYKVF